MLNLPIMTRLKSLSIDVASRSQVEEEDLAPLFDLTTLRELELSGMQINTRYVSGFSRLCSIRSISLSVVYSTLTEDENRINFEEFQALKYLTSLKVSGLALTEKDFGHIGKLTSLISLDIYDDRAYPESLSNLSHLTGLWIYVEAPGCVGELQIKNFTNLETLFSFSGSFAADFIHLKRLRDLSVFGDVSGDTPRSQGT
jgi:hypothetical protein